MVKPDGIARLAGLIGLERAAIDDAALEDVGGWMPRAALALPVASASQGWCFQAASLAAPELASFPFS